MSRWLVGSPKTRKPAFLSISFASARRERSPPEKAGSDSVIRSSAAPFAKTDLPAHIIIMSKKLSRVRFWLNRYGLAAFPTLRGTMTWHKLPSNIRTG